MNRPRLPWWLIIQCNAGQNTMNAFPYSFYVVVVRDFRSGIPERNRLLSPFRYWLFQKNYAACDWLKQIAHAVFFIWICGEELMCLRLVGLRRTYVCAYWMELGRFGVGVRRLVRGSWETKRNCNIRTIIRDFLSPWIWKWWRWMLFL